MSYELSLKSLRALTLVAETGSVKHAAEQMHITQPALSQHLARVSEKFGVQVVERRGRGIQLTEVGQVVVAYARDIQRSLDAADLAVADLHGLLRGKVRVGMLQSVNMNIFPRAVSLLRKRYPGIRTKAYELSSEQIEHAIISGDLDLGIGLTERFHERINTVPLYSDIIMLAGRHDENMTADTSFTLEEISRMPLALLSDEFTTRKLIDFHCAEAQVTLRPVIETNTISSLLELIREGDVKSLLPYSALLGSKGNGLCLVPLIKPCIKRKLAILQRKDAIASPAAVAFASAVQEVASGLAQEHGVFLSVSISVQASAARSR